MSSTMLRRFAVALAAAGAIVAGSAGTAEARRVYVVTQVVRPAPVVVYRYYTPRVVYYRAPRAYRYAYTRY